MVPEAGMVVPASVGAVPRAECDVPAPGVASMPRAGVAVSVREQVVP